MNTQPLEATLPQHCYLSAEFFREEERLIFAREWFCVGRESQLEQTGSYQAINLAGENLILSRDETGTLHAFYNVCRHRGAELVSTANNALPCGQFKGGIRCPYHSWFYGLDGTLKQTPHLDIDTSAFPLHEASLSVWNGFVFVRLAGNHDSTDAASLADTLAPVTERIKRYDLATLVTAKSIRYEVNANWKVILENYNECYHCAGVHPELCKIVPAFRKNGGADLDWDKGIPHKQGANTFTLSGTTTRAPFPHLNSDEKENHKGELVYPNLMISLAMDHVAVFTLWPGSEESTHIDCDFLFHPDEVANSTFDPEDAVSFWDLVNRQDWAICESVQRGMQSSKFEHGYYAPMEDFSLDIRNYVRRLMGGQISLK